MSRRKYFGTDGVRGPGVGQAPITPDFCHAAGLRRATVRRWLPSEIPSGSTCRPLIGKDTRLPVMLGQPWRQVFGGRRRCVFLVGPLPTPAVAYRRVCVCRPGSLFLHPFTIQTYDNGIKFFSAAGATAGCGAAIEVRGSDEPMVCAPPARILGRGQADRRCARSLYRVLQEHFPNDLDLRGLKIWSTVPMVPPSHRTSVFHELGAEVVSISVQPNGLNINDRLGDCP